MIENVNANGMMGQMEIGDFEGTEGAGDREQGTGMAVGYDEAGNLINPGAGAIPGENTDQVDQEAGLLAEVMGDVAASADTVGAPMRGRPLDADEQRLAILASEINAITNHARVVLASAAIDIGKRLIEAKNIVPRGRWTEWLEANVDYSERKAQQLMQLAEEFGRGELPASFAGLGLSQMTALLAAPEGEREAIAEKAVDEGLSVRELQEEIRKLKAETDEKQMKLDLQAEKLESEKGRYEQALDRVLEDKINAENAIEREREAVKLAEAKARSAEESADALRKLHSDAEDRAAASAQRASDAVNRANRLQEALREAEAKIAKLGDEKSATPTPEVQTVEVIPEAVQNELADLRRQLAEAKAAGDHAGSPLQGEGAETAVARFRDSYKRLTDEFKTAEALIAEIVKDDAATGHMYATAMVKSCKMMIDRLGE